MAMLHNQEQDRSVYACSICEKHVEARYHCTVCVDFNLCVNCFYKDGHQHKMDRHGCGSQQITPHESRVLAVERCTNYLVHALKCRDTNCKLPSCQKMKRVVQHANSCKQKASGGCPICKQLIALLVYHKKHCQETKCPVCVAVNMVRQELQRIKTRNDGKSANVSFDLKRAD